MNIFIITFGLQLSNIVALVNLEDNFNKHIFPPNRCRSIIFSLKPLAFGSLTISHELFPFFCSKLPMHYGSYLVTFTFAISKPLQCHQSYKRRMREC